MSSAWLYLCLLVLAAMDLCGDRPLRFTFVCRFAFETVSYYLAQALALPPLAS